MRVLCFGLDGADYDLVRELLAQGRLPTLGRLAREGSFGPLHSTIPAFTPTAWSSFLTGLNPAGHGIFSFTSNPNRALGRLESAASRGGTPLWRVLGGAGIRSAFVTVPFTHPPEPIDGVLVTGFGGPPRPEVVPLSARNAIFASHPDLVTAPHPPGWWRDFGNVLPTLRAHVEDIADVCLLAMELEPDLGLLCVDFMSSDVAGHISWHRLDESHPARRNGEEGDELLQVYGAVDRACGELVAQAAWLWDEEPTTIVLSDHGMKPTHWLFHANRCLEEMGYLRYRPGTAAPPPRHLDETVEPGLERAGDDGANDAPFAEIDFAATRAYCFGYGGQIYLSEVTGAVEDRRLERELADALAAVAHPETGKPAFDVRRKNDLYRGFYIEKAPELVIIPRDERIHIDSSRRRWPAAFERNDRLGRPGFFSGNHGARGIFGAAGPAIRPADLPEDAEITQMAATLLALFGISASVDAPPIEAILDPVATGERTPVAPGSLQRREGPVYSRDEERRIVERLRDFGYE